MMTTDKEVCVRVCSDGVLVPVTERRLAGAPGHNNSAPTEVVTILMLPPDFVEAYYGRRGDDTIDVPGCKLDL